MLKCSYVSKTRSPALRAAPEESWQLRLCRPRPGNLVPEDARRESVQQGLYVCLPAEQLTLVGFAQGGEADTMAPGPLLAAVVHTVTGQDGSGAGWVLG